jgi:hypothetical protein
MSVTNAGSNVSVMEAPPQPIFNRPPFLGSAAQAEVLNSTGDKAAVRPKAETLAKNSRRFILPCDNISSSFSKTVIWFPSFR